MWTRLTSAWSGVVNRVVGDVVFHSCVEFTGAWLGRRRRRAAPLWGGSGSHEVSVRCGWTSPPAVRGRARSWIAIILRHILRPSSVAWRVGGRGPAASL